MIERYGRFQCFSPKICELIDGLFDHSRIHVRGRARSIDSEHEKPAARLIGESGQVLSQSLLVGRQRRFPVQFVEFMPRVAAD